MKKNAEIKDGMLNNKEKWGNKTSKNSRNIRDSASESAIPDIEKKIDAISEQALWCHSC